VERVVAEGTFH
jgi:hypothetical protein